MKASKTTERSAGLDLVRCLAIVMVVSCHSAILLRPTDEHSFAGSLAHAWIRWVSPFGLYGVELFFALSGFLIGRIVFREAVSDDRPLLVRLRWFWARRWMRTIPLYLLVLALNIILMNRISPSKWDWRYLVFAQNLVAPHPDFFAAAWSLSVEEWFYLLFPAWILMASSFVKKGGAGIHLVCATLVFALVFVWVRTIHVHGSTTLDLGTDVRKVVLYRLDAIAYGAMAAWFSYFRPVASARYRVPLFLVGLLVLGSTIWLNEHLPATRPGRTEQGSFVLLLLSVAFAALMPLMSSITRDHLRAFAGTVKFVSLISYPMYLCHSSLVLKVLVVLQFLHTGLSPWLLFWLYWIGILVIAFALHWMVEKPVLLLREKIWPDDHMIISGKRQLN